MAAVLLAECRGACDDPRPSCDPQVAEEDAAKMRAWEEAQDLTSGVGLPVTQDAILRDISTVRIDLPGPEVLTQ